ncbi:cytochrome C [Chitinophaga lutea]|uniref:Cytochrome C n=1 Tax=Chitinophaga lutea TaxID=2488634 RepID=A0A3N4PWG2_9BACT|nr:heme-binding domain-containing protein [Chitinophaga lutea]RPE08070.1 cytochrome C [Chitinophaga lutea]
MSRRKKWLAGILIILAGIQFIQPVRNESGQAFSSDITGVVATPPHIAAILKAACYDCHSNNTRYPWYTYVQPAGWVLARHVAEGKEELNFHLFGTYTPRRQASKLRSIASSIKDGTMPLISYKWLHPEARLTPAQREAVLHWLEGIGKD